MQFRPCIDLRLGQVVQIVGSTLTDAEQDQPVTNFVSGNSSGFYASMYRKDNLKGGHVIALGPGNESAALEALSTYPGGLQMGGGVNPDNAFRYLDAGASHVIVTSYCIRDGILDWGHLKALSQKVGHQRLVLDLSCRKKGGKYFVVSNRWQLFTGLEVNEATLDNLASYCDEFLVHGVDVEGKQSGIEHELVSLLGKNCPIPVTYAGGVREFADMETVNTLGEGRVDLTIGSALDIFGGKLPYRDVVNWCKKQGGIFQ